MKKTHSVVIPGDVNTQLLAHLIREDKQEDLCFGLYNPSTGKNRFTAIIDEIILPNESDRQVHGNVSFNPEYYERVIKLAMENKKGIAFLHSHASGGFQEMSFDDINAESGMAGAVKSVTGIPLLGLTTGNDGTWSARFWFRALSLKKRYNKIWCESVRVFSNRLTIHYHPTLVKSLIDEEQLMRTISAWGKRTQADISKMKVGIVGLGSVGSMVCEALARIGFANLTLIDFDNIEMKNLDRLMNVKKSDVGKKKVDVIAKAIKQNATAGKINVKTLALSIYERDAYMSALDCDILFSCVDRPHPRQILNYIAYAHCIPVIDGGILVRTNRSNTKMIGADWKIQTVGYDRPCLECLGQYSEQLASLDKEGYLDDPTYMEGADETIKLVNAHENVFAFSMNVASFEVLQLLSLIVLPEVLAKHKQQFYHFSLKDFEDDVKHSCNEHCIYPTLIGKGDNTGVTVFKQT